MLLAPEKYGMPSYREGICSVWYVKVFAFVKFHMKRLNFMNCLGVQAMAFWIVAAVSPRWFFGVSSAVNSLIKLALKSDTWCGLVLSG